MTRRALLLTLAVLPVVPVAQVVASATPAAEPVNEPTPEPQRDVRPLVLDTPDLWLSLGKNCESVKPSPTWIVLCGDYNYEDSPSGGEWVRMGSRAV